MALQVTYRYKDQVTDQGVRRSEGIKVKKRFPAKVPLVIGRVNISELLDLERNKFLFPATATVGNLIQFINSKIGRHEDDVLYIYIQNELIAAKDSNIASLYQEYREDDYFLYLAYFERDIYNTESKT